MVRKVVLSVVVGVVTWLVVALAGSVLESVNQETVAAIGRFLENYAVLFGLLAGVWYFFTNQTPGDVL